MKLRESIARLFGMSRPELIDRSINRAASLCADAEGKRVAALFYTDLLLDVDPDADWWAFADLKQKQFDSQQDYAILNARAETAVRKANEIIGSGK